MAQSLSPNTCSSLWFLTPFLCAKTHTTIILSQKNAPDISAERYADIIKPTDKLLTFIWEMWRLPWHLARFITVREMPGRKTSQTSLQSRSARAIARPKFLKSEYKALHGYTEHDCGRAYICHRSREDVGHYKLTVAKLGCLFLDIVFASINYQHQKHL